MENQRSTSPLVVAAVASSILGLFLAAGAVGGVYVWRTTGAPQPAPAPVAATTDWPMLVADEQTRLDLGAFFRDLARQTELNRERLATLATWREAYRLAAQSLQAEPSYPSVAPIDGEVERRLRLALGVPAGPIADQPLDLALTARLTGELRAIAAELGAP